MLCAHNTHFPTNADLQSTQCTDRHPNSAASSRFRAIRDCTHTNPEFVWGDEGPVNERRQALKTG
jgi:hypothetical protein